MRKALWLLVALLSLGGAAALLMRRAMVPEEVPPALLPTPDALELPRELSVLFLGAVADPGSAQVQIEQDLELARDVLGGPFLTLFGGGRGARFVHELGEVPEPAGIQRALTELFSARSLAHTYRRPRIHVDGPGTLEMLDLALGHARAAESPLPLLYVAGHGERGDLPTESHFSLWGDEVLTPADLASFLADAPSTVPLRLVATTCYSGAFAEIVFDEADESLGPAESVHCGLFATTAEDEASGCDADPDRARQEGFGVHFLSALRGLGRDGAPLERADLDGDGAVSLLEAHAHARIAGASIDVPTLTSERFLRYAVPDATEDRPGDDPVETYVVESLSRALGLPTREAAEEKLLTLGRAFDVQTEELADAAARADEAYAGLRIALLEIVPFVDDRWHPRWEAEVATHAEALSAVLTRSDEAEALRVAVAIEENIEAGLVRAQAELARTRRLVRAHENLALLGHLTARGGEELERYRALRECERFTPRLARPER